MRYHTKEGWELVVEAPQAQKIDIEFAPDAHVLSNVDVGSLRRERDRDVFHSEGVRRVNLSLDVVGKQLPQVFIDGREVPILMTSLKLPLKSSPIDLPLEDKGQLPEVSSHLLAYLIRVSDLYRESRSIVTTNPQFEKVLREWGYLNDN